VVKETVTDLAGELSMKYLLLVCMEQPPDPPRETEENAARGEADETGDNVDGRLRRDRVRQHG
jgi:hypothetical protein